MKKRTFALLSVILCTFASYAQGTCPGDVCFDAPEIEFCTDTYLCTEHCEEDFYSGVNGVPYMSPMVGVSGTIECHGINVDRFVYFDMPEADTPIPESIDSIATITIYDPYDPAYPDNSNDFDATRGLGCYNPASTYSSNFGWNEGWAMMLWMGDDCLSSEIVWSTNCYWLTDTGPGEFPSGSYTDQGAFDPTRQYWNVQLLGMRPGQRYFLQLDGFGWCQGCTYVNVCPGANNLAIEFPEDMQMIDLTEEKRKPDRITNILQQEIEFQYNTTMIYYYSDGSTEKVHVIQ